MKNQIRKIGFASILFMASTTVTVAQTNALHITPQGNVGINTNNPQAKLHVQTDNNRNTLRLWNNNSLTGSKYGLYNYLRGSSFTNGFYNFTYQNPGASSSVYGIRSYTYARSSNAYGQYNYLHRYSGTSTSYGIYSYVGKASSLNSTEYGIYSGVSGSGTGAKYGVYSTVPTTATNWYAGYFNGNVHMTGTLTVASDASKKKNVKSIVNAMDLIQRIDGKSYEFVNDDDNNFSKGIQFGFMAQELQKVLPELVLDIEAPGAHKQIKKTDQAALDGEEKQETTEDFEEGKADNYKSVNYIGLIPILVEALKEQQAQLEEQQKTIDELKKQLK